MNTINGNFIERVIPNIKNATLNLLIGDQLATMNLADFQAAIVPSSKGLKMKDNLPLDATLNNVVDSSDVVTISPLQLSTEQVGVLRTVNLAAGATNPRLFNVAYTINNSGAQTGTLTGIFLNATETALNGITHNLLDLQVGGVSQFLVSKIGNITTKATDWANLNASGLFITSLNATASNQAPLTLVGTSIILRGTAAGFLWLTVGNTNIDFGNAQTLRWGTTSSFPAIKRNGAAIDFRLADDSAYTTILASKIGVNTNRLIDFLDGSNIRIGCFTSIFMSAWNTAAYEDIFKITGNSTTPYTNIAYSLGVGFFTTPNTSAILQADSTTKGFLMPRMTQAQILLIATPAAGLMVYNTDLQAPCFYDGTAARWEKISHSNM